MKRYILMLSAVICLFGLIRCGGTESGSATAFTLSATGNLSIYMCKEFTATVTDAEGTAVAAPADISVAITGARAGKVFTSLANCQSDSESNTLTVASGATSASAWYRTSTEGSETLTGTATGYGSATVTLTATDFRVLGDVDPATSTYRINSVGKAYGLFITGTKLIASDQTHNRVLIWNTLPTAAGQLPDLVLGQPNLSSSIPEGTAVNATTFNRPAGIWSDGTKLLVVDVLNHRVLIWNTFPTTNQQAADLVIGQSSFTSGSSNAGGVTSATGFNSPDSVWVQGSYLYVSDTFNNRVLGWDTIPSANGTAADFVLGQPDFTTSSAGNTNAKFRNPRGIASSGSNFYVVDQDNHRVAGFLSQPTSDNPPADFMLGQSDLVSTTSGTTATKLYYPEGISVSGAKLLVSDKNNHRVLVWNALPTSFGTNAASFAIGQANLTSGSSNTSATGMSQPYGLATNGTNLYVGDISNFRILGFNSVPTASNTAADFALGQPSGADNLTTGIDDSLAVSGARMGKPDHVISDGTRLMVVDSYRNRVLVWNTLPTSSTQSADFALGQPADSTNLTSSTSNNPSVSATTLSNPKSGMIANDKLYIVDNSNHRVLIWNTIPTAAGTAADLVIGQSDFTSSSSNGGGATSASVFDSPRGIWSHGTKVFVADENNSRVLVWNSAPTASGQAADVVIGQSNFSSNSSATSATELYYPVNGAVIDSKLYVADTGNNRVLIWNSVPTSNGASADLVMGQANLTASSSATTATGMNYPSSIIGAGGRIFVEDNYSRVLVFNSAPTANGTAANSVLGQSTLTGTAYNNASAVSATVFGDTGHISTDGSRLFVPDKFNRRIVVLPVH